MVFPLPRGVYFTVTMVWNMSGIRGGACTRPRIGGLHDAMYPTLYATIASPVCFAL